MLQLKEFYDKYEHYFVTFKRADSESLAKREKVHFVQRPGRNPVMALINFIQSLQLTLKEKPDLIIATGADASVASCLWGKLFRKKVIYVESFCRPSKPSISGRIVYKIADEFIVQWKEVWKYYPNAKFGGSIF